MKTTLLFCFALALAGSAVAQSFPKSALVKPDGKETDVILMMGSDRLTIVAKDDGIGPIELPYSTVKSAEYSFSTGTRWKSAVLLAWPAMFLKGKKHWLAIIGEGEAVVLHLDKKNYKAILASFEAKTGKKVETILEQK